MTEEEKDEFYIQKTREHIARVKDIGFYIVGDIQLKFISHDKSKLQEPEFKGFREATPELRKSSYMSDEYKKIMQDDLKETLKHHYANNTHHPEHYENGINGMTLMDLIEMIADWWAASERHPDGSVEESIKLNSKRFNLSPQLEDILNNTIKELKNK